MVPIDIGEDDEWSSTLPIISSHKPEKLSKYLLTENMQFGRSG
jgi:hypothetical protein